MYSTMVSPVTSSAGKAACDVAFTDVCGPVTNAATTGDQRCAGKKSGKCGAHCEDRVAGHP
jgi:hypothetical protein